MSARNPTVPNKQIASPQTRSAPALSRIVPKKSFRERQQGSASYPVIIVCYYVCWMAKRTGEPAVMHDTVPAQMCVPLRERELQTLPWGRIKSAPYFFACEAGYICGLCSAVTTEEKPPRTLKSPRTVMERG